MIRGNISQFARNLRSISSVTLFKRAGESLKEAIEDEFDVLLEETPQYSGSTVASYRLGLGSGTEDVHVELPEPASAQEAFAKGSQAAINIARSASAGALPESETLIKRLRTSDIVVTNGAPQWERAEEGPLRPVNEPVGAFNRFEERIADKIIEVNLGDL